MDSDLHTWLNTLREAHRDCQNSNALKSQVSFGKCETSVSSCVKIEHEKPEAEPGASLHLFKLNRSQKWRYFALETHRAFQDRWSKGDRGKGQKNSEGTVCGLDCHAVSLVI